MQRTRNLEWTLKRICYILLRLAMQYSDQPKQMSYEDDGKRTYATYGNSFAQADEIMQPQPMNEGAQEAMATGKPMVGENEAEKKRYDQEVADYEKFLEVFRTEEGEFDPVFFDFDVEIQNDSSLPTDKQSRANLGLKLRQVEAIDTLSLLNLLGIPGATEIVERLQKEKGGGGDLKEMMAANPELAAKLKQMQGAKQ
jgi:hypothetical protein